MSSNKKVNLKKVILSAAIILLTLSGVLVYVLSWQGDTKDIEAVADSFKPLDGWQEAERKNVQAKLKVNVKKTLAKYGYPPDQQALATDMVLEQVKRYGNEWSQKRAAYEAGGGASLLD